MIITLVQRKYTNNQLIKQILMSLFTKY